MSPMSYVAFKHLENPGEEERRAAHLVCLVSVIGVRKQGFVLSLLFYTPLLQVKLPLSFKVEPVLLVLYRGTPSYR